MEGLKRLLGKIVFGDDERTVWKNRRYRAELVGTGSDPAGRTPVELLLTRRELRVGSRGGEPLFRIQMRAPLRIQTWPVMPPGVQASISIVFEDVLALFRGGRRCRIEWFSDGGSHRAELVGGHDLARLYTDLRSWFPFVSAQSADLG